VRVLAVVAVLTIATACGSSSGHSSASGGAVPPNVGATVELRDIAFKPSTVTIKAGQSVLWKFDDGSIAHNVTGDGYRSSDMTSGTYSHAFTKAGTYNYQCTIHSGMNGEVIVTP
jgi:plastocyanin